VSFPTKLLAPGEEIYLDSRPNWSYLFWPAVITVLVFAGCVAVAVLWSSAPIVKVWVLLGCGLCALIYFGAHYIGWCTKSFVVTSQRIVYRTGALRRTGREIPIGRVQDVTYHQTIVERLVRAGSLTVESAGRQGQDPFPDISKPAEVQSLINRINRIVVQATTGQVLAPRPAAARGAEDGEFAGPPVAPPPPPATDPTPRIPPLGTDSAPRPVLSPNAAQQLRRLTELYQQGVITDAEYEQKCREALEGS
jgi:membrane protein YdbS with pleckstrin-like domain